MERKGARVGGETDRQRERDRERQIDRQRETETDRDRQTGRQTKTEIQRQTEDRKTDTDTEIKRPCIHSAFSVQDTCSQLAPRCFIQVTQVL